MSEEEKVFDTNDIMSCFKMSVDVNGIKRIEEYINKLEQENKELSRMVEIYSKSLYNAELTQLKEVIEEVRDKLYCWGEVLDVKFQQDVLQILDKTKGE